MSKNKENSKAPFQRKGAKPKSEQIKDLITKEIFSSENGRPNLAIVVFGDEHKYFKNIKDLEKEAKKCGIDTNLYICERDSSQMAAEGILEFLNNDDAIDAIYIQGPAPEEINFEQLLSSVDGEKDVSFQEEEDFENIDWDLLEARIFEAVLERFSSNNE